MSWTLTERLGFAAHDSTLPTACRMLLHEAAERIAALEDAGAVVAREADESADAFSRLARDINDVLRAHGV